MPQRIVILTQKEIGDLIVVTPLIRALRHAYRHSDIFIVSRPVAREIYAGNPAITGFSDVMLAKVKRGNIFSRIAAFFRYGWQIRRLKPDILLQLEANDVMALWSLFSGAKIRISVRNQTFARFFTAINRFDEGQQSALLFYLGFLDPLGVPAQGLQTELFAAGKQQSPYSPASVFIHPGGRIAEKLWPVSKWRELILLIRKKYPKIPIRIARSVFDQEICAGIESGLPKKAGIIWTPVNNFRDLCEALSRASLAIVMDSSPRHVAAAYNTPTIAILPRWTLQDWGIYDEKKHRSVVSEAIRPRHGLETIEVAAVFTAFENYWRELSKRSKRK